MKTLYRFPLLHTTAVVSGLLGLTAAQTVLAQTVFTFSRTQPFETRNVLTYTGTTVGGPRWQRPLAGNPPTGVSSLGNNVPYHVQSFVAAETGAYDFLSLGTNPVNWDNFLVLYRTSFNPAAPLSNVIIANDDFPSVGRSGFNGVNLIAGTTYHIVTTGFSNTSAGEFTNTVNITRNERTIPDNTPAGRTSTITVGQSGYITAFNSITIEGLTHTWIGDLTATLSHGGITVELFDRVGRTSSAGFGSSGDLNGNYTFVEGGPPLPTTGNVPAGTYGRYPNNTPGQTLTFNFTFDDFVGMDMAGDWTLHLIDHAAGDVGSFTGWRFSVTAVPEPGTYALLAAMVLPGVLLARRRIK
ncbi:MAG: proprotein convertase P-domain-containing protein [Chloroherpetonaceae bacterium]|nr:proprotein convertase P-domain-containing protein [Chthonomonadaceae bacterium]MDW8208909.1 proprotein convertase P-domain-containing protein [Chloroherpetonaceae bacterium]